MKSVKHRLFNMSFTSMKPVPFLITSAFVLVTISVVVKSLQTSTATVDAPRVARLRLSQSPLVINTRSCVLPAVGMITVSNEGNAPLTFSATASCGCTELTPGRATLAPGSSIEVSLTIDLPLMQKSERPVLVVFNSNDAESSRTELTVKASRSPPADFSTTRVDFGPVIVGSTPSRQISISRRITDFDSVPIILRPNDSEWFDAKMMLTSSEAAVRIQLSPHLHLGHHDDALIFDIGPESVRLPVQALIVNSDFVVMPRDITLFSSETAKPNEKVFTVWRIDHKNLGDLLRATFVCDSKEFALQATDPDPSESGPRRVMVTIPEVRGALIPKQLRIFFKDFAEPVVVPVKYFPSPETSKKGV